MAKNVHWYLRHARGLRAHQRSAGAFAAFADLEDFWFQHVELLAHSPELTARARRKLERVRARSKGIRDFDILCSPNSYVDSARWWLFWALVEAEGIFARRFIPIWGNEERLTGELVAALACSVDRAESLRVQRKRHVPGYLDILYGNTASRGREGPTGADIGLVLHSNIGGRDECRAFLFQAKKADQNGKSDISQVWRGLEQLDRLTRVRGLGYYLFYHPKNSVRATPPPTVRSADDIKTERAASSKKTSVVEALDGSYSLSAFLSFSAVRPIGFSAAPGLTAQGLDVPSPGAAFDLFFGRELEDLTPRRILVMALGDGDRPSYWHELTDHLSSLERASTIARSMHDIRQSQKADQDRDVEPPIQIQIT